MKWVLSATLILLIVQIQFGQSKDEILKSDIQIFKNSVELNPEKFGEKEFDKLYDLSESLSLQNKFSFAESYAKKAKILAEKLKSPLLLAKGYYLLAKSQPPQGINKSKAEEFYRKAILLFSEIQQNEETKLVLWRILSDYSILDSSPEYIHTEDELNAAVKTLFRIFKLAGNHQGAGYEDIKVRSLSYLSNYFAVKGNIPTQIVWLENALKQVEKSPESLRKLSYTFDIYVRLQKAYRRVGDYDKAFYVLEKMEEFLKKHPDEIRELEYLRNLADSSDDLQNNPKAYKALDEGIKLARRNNYRIAEFLTAKILKLLQDTNVSEAKKEFNSLQILNRQGIYVEKLDIPTINAVISGYEGDIRKSDEFFAEAESILRNDLRNEWVSTMFVLYWKSKVTLFQKRYDDLIRFSNQSLELATQNVNKDALPWVYLNLALAEFGKQNLVAARDYNQKAIDLIETKRLSQNAQISVRIMEVLNEAYQLEITLDQEENRSEESFLASEKLKSRWLNDKITQKLFVPKQLIDDKTRLELFNSSLSVLENIDHSEPLSNLAYLEKRSVDLENKNANVQIADFNFQSFHDIFRNLNQTAIISYAFTSNGKLSVFVIQSNKGLEVKTINLTINEAEKMASELQKQIKNGIYFKNDGQKLYNILLKPLNLDGIRHLIIIPDKALWKIPFQLLSADGRKFLIEDFQISYSPSVSVLQKLITLPKPTRETFQVFSNSKYNNYYLIFADSEAKSLAQIFGVKPYLNSSTEQFVSKASNSDILHFSMHAEVDEIEPFNSFLAFNKSGANPSGKLRVSDLLNINLRKQSLVFLASCATDNVLKGEGLLSLAWGMMNVGASTVISTQWEANDESTEQFTQRFYKYYRLGFSGAESLQKASIEIIKSPNQRLNKPYNWAEFTLNGDFR